MEHTLHSIAPSKLKENTPPSSYRDPPRVHGTASIAARSVTALDPNREGESISTMEAITLKEMALSLRNKRRMQFEAQFDGISPDTAKIQNLDRQQSRPSSEGSGRGSTIHLGLPDITTKSSSSELFRTSSGNHEATVAAAGGVEDLGTVVEFVIEACTVAWDSDGY